MIVLFEALKVDAEELVVDVTLLAVVDVVVLEVDAKEVVVGVVILEVDAK